MAKFSQTFPIKVAQHLSSVDRLIVAIVISVKSPESDWQKVDYLMEFGEWLFVNEYPVADALDQVSEP